MRNSRTVQFRFDLQPANIVTRYQSCIRIASGNDYTWGNKMRNWGWILVVGNSEPSTAAICQYLKKGRLAFDNLSLDERIDSMRSYSMAFVCGSTHSEPNVILQLEELKKLKIPTAIVVSDFSQYFSDKCQRNGLGTPMQLPLNDMAMSEVLNTAMYRSDAALLKAAMPTYARKLKQLEDRERLIVQMAADGATNRRIATCVGLAEKTVERIRQKLRKKLNVNSVAEMTQVVTLGMVFELGTPPAFPIPTAGIES